MSRCAADEAEILSVAVDPKSRGRGLAGDLLRHHLARIAARGITKIFLEVGEDNRSALRLYNRAGFREVGKTRGLLSTAGRRDFRARPAARIGVTPRSLPGPFAAAKTMTAATKDRALSVSKASSIEEACIQSGMRMTEQRRVIARVLGSSRDHPDVEELYRRASAIDDKISMSTVYRTMKLFEDAGIIEKHDFGDGRSRYEQAPDEHHDHLINLRTGKVIEFRSEEIEKLQVEVARRLGFKLVDHRLELYALPLDDEKKS